MWAFWRSGNESIDRQSSCRESVVFIVSTAMSGRSDTVVEIRRPSESSLPSRFNVPREELAIVSQTVSKEHKLRSLQISPSYCMIQEAEDDIYNLEEGLAYTKTIT